MDATKAFDVVNHGSLLCKLHDMEYEANEAAAKACPVNIIHVKILDR